MKVLILISCLYPHGAEYSCLRHILDSKKNYKTQFHVISILGGRLEKELLINDISCFILSKNLSVKGLYKMTKLIKQEQFDIIHSWMYHSNVLGSILSILTKKPLITSIRQALPSYKSLRLRTIIISFLDSILSRYKAKFITFNSISGLDDHTKKLIYNKRKCIYIPNQPYIIPFKKTNVKNYTSKEFISGEAIKILSLARDDVSKNLSYMISLIKETAKDLKASNKKIILNLYGDGMDSKKLKLKYISNLPENLLINFNDKSSEISGILLNHDIYISTSLWEGYPNSLITATTSGCIPICTDAGDSWKLLGDFTYKLSKNILIDKNILFKAISKSTSINRNDFSKDYIDFLKKLYKNSMNYNDLYRRATEN